MAIVTGRCHSDIFSLRVRVFRGTLKRTLQFSLARPTPGGKCTTTAWFCCGLGAGR